MTKDLTLADVLKRLADDLAEQLQDARDGLHSEVCLAPEDAETILSALRGEEWQGGVVGIVAYDLDHETITLRMNGKSAVRRAYTAIPQANRAVFSERTDG